MNDDNISNFDFQIFTFEVVCVDDNNKPDIIPIEKWVKVNQIYNVISIIHHIGETDSLSYCLKEIKDLPYPFEGININRFVTKLKNVPIFQIMLTTSVTDLILEEIDIDTDLKTKLRELNITWIN